MVDIPIVFRPFIIVAMNSGQFTSIPIYSPEFGNFLSGSGACADEISS